MVYINVVAGGWLFSMCLEVNEVVTRSKSIVITCKCGSTRFVVDLERFEGRKEVRQGFGGFEVAVGGGKVMQIGPTLF